jgi:SAM-dependent methyltransferase
MSVWEHYGKNDPYYGVLSCQEYRAGALDEEARRKFFLSGVEVVDGFIALAEETFGPLRFGTALDYGCGVGRLTRRLAERFGEVVGVDISTHMLEEAGRNLAEQGNARFEPAGAMGATPVDFIMSKIVFQHIPPAEGVRVLAGRLAPGGTGILDLPIRYTGGRIRRLLSTVRGLLPSREPIIPLHIYDLDAIRAVLARTGCQMREKISSMPLYEKAVVIFHRPMGPPGFEPGTDGL